jgi:hypothetical protein
MRVGNGHRPTHRLKATGPQKDTGKNFWSVIGSGWQRDDGTISVTVNDGLNLLLTRGTRLILTPVEEQQTSHTMRDDDGIY